MSESIFALYFQWLHLTVDHGESIKFWDNAYDLGQACHTASSPTATLKDPVKALDTRVHNSGAHANLPSTGQMLSTSLQSPLKLELVAHVSCLLLGIFFHSQHAFVLSLHRSTSTSRFEHLLGATHVIIKNL